MRRMLDLYGGQGGAGEGYRRSAFAMYAVDRDDHAKRYPGAFHRGDVIDVLTRMLAGEKIPFTHRDGSIEWLGLDDFVAIHASPPCQAYSIATAGNATARAKHDRLIAVTRDLLEQTGLPYVIENVEQARDELRDPLMLCGTALGLHATDVDGITLELWRHRLFETNWPLTQPYERSCYHGRWGAVPAGVYGGARRARTRYRLTSHDGVFAATVDRLPEQWLRRDEITDTSTHVIPDGWTVEKITPTPAEDRYAARFDRGGGYVPRSIEVQQRLLRIDWMTVRGMQESIPPAYATAVGDQLARYIETRSAA